MGIVNEFDSEYSKLAACAARREENGGVCDDVESCDIGWCADCRDALNARKDAQEHARAEARKTYLQREQQRGRHAATVAEGRARRGARVR